MEMRSETHNEWTESSTDVSGRPSGSGSGGGGLYTDNSHSASQLQTRSQSRDGSTHQAAAAQQRSSRGQRPSGRHIPDASPPPRLPAEYAALKKKEPSPRHAPTRAAVKKAAVSSEDDAAEENGEEEEEYDEAGSPSQPFYEDNTNDEEGEEAEEGEYDEESEEEDDEDDWESADKEDEEEQEGEDAGFSGARALQDEFDESRGKSSQPSVSTVVKYPFSLHTSKPAPQAGTSFGAAFAASAFRRATPQPRAGYSMGYTAQDGVSSEEAPKPSPPQPQEDEEAATAPPPAAAAAAAAATSAFGFGFGAVNSSSVMGVSGGEVKKTAFGASQFPTHGFGTFGAASTAAAATTTTTGTTGEAGTAGSTAVASPFSLSSPFPMTAAVPVVAEALKTIPEVKVTISSPTTATESKPENEAAAAVVTLDSSATDKKEGAAFAFPTSSSSVLSGAAAVQVEGEGSVVKPAFGGDGSAPGLPYPLPASKLVSAMHEGFSGLALSDATTNKEAGAPSVKPPSSSQFTAFAFSTVPNSTPAFGAGGGAATRPFGVLDGLTDKATNAFAAPFAFSAAGAAAATVAAAPVPTEKKPNCSPLPGGFSDRPFGVVPGLPSPLPTAVGGWSTAAPTGEAPSAPLTVASKTAPFPLFGFQPARKDAPAAWGSGGAPQAFGGTAVGGAPVAVFGGFTSLAGGTSKTQSDGAAGAAAKTDPNAADTPLQARKEPSMKAEPPSVSSSPRSPMRPTVAIVERQEEAEESDINNNSNDDNNNNGSGDASSVCSTSVDYKAMVASPVVLPPEDEEEGEEGEEKCTKEATDSSSTNSGGGGNAGGHTTIDVAGLLLGQKPEPHTTATNTEVSQLSYHSCVEARDAAMTVDLTTKKEEEESCSRESEARKEKTARLAATGPCPTVEAILSSVTDTGNEAALLTSACEREEKEERKGESDSSRPLNGAPLESSPLQTPTPQPAEHQGSTVTATSSVAAAATAVVDSLHALRDDVKAAQTADVSPPSPGVQRTGRTLLPRPQAPQLPPVVVKVTIKQLYNSTQQNHQWMAANTTTTTTTVRRENKEDAAALRSSRGAPEVALYCRPLLIHLPNPPLHTSAMSAAGENAVLRSTVMFLRFVFGWLLPAVVRLLVHVVVAVGLVVLAVVVADGVWCECPMVRVWAAEAKAYLQQLPIEQYKTMLLELWESRK